MRILVVDNYDSFTFNLVQPLRALGHDVVVVRNDEVDAAGALARDPDRIVLSPGPNRPEQAGVCVALIPAAAARGIPILGVCLGLQCLAVAYGASVVQGHPRHGRTSPVLHDGRGVFTGLPSPLEGARYHSLVVDPQTLPPELEASAWTEDGALMGLRHRALPLMGVQFHPESYLTETGSRLLENFLERSP